jgi:hypothetical protein
MKDVLFVTSHNPCESLELITKSKPIANVFSFIHIYQFINLSLSLSALYFFIFEILLSRLGNFAIMLFSSTSDINKLELLMHYIDIFQQLLRSLENYHLFVHFACISLMAETKFKTSKLSNDVFRIDRL